MLQSQAKNVEEMVKSTSDAVRSTLESLLRKPVLKNLNLSSSKGLEP
ncbi:hypothetical protein Taro_031340, partial [Colocasia esculenta]|nr:hypothetical protein [Colocasia esculenta]